MDLFKPNIQKMKNKKNVHGLIRALSNKDWRVRRDAAEALGNIENEMGAALLERP